MPDSQVSTSAKLQALFDSYLERIEKNRSFIVNASDESELMWTLVDARTCTLRLEGDALTLTITDTDGEDFTLMSLQTVKVFMGAVFPK